MAPRNKPPRKAKKSGGPGHSYVSKDKGAAKARVFKTSVVAWLHGDPDAELIKCLSGFAKLMLWKEFAQTLGRSQRLLLLLCNYSMNFTVWSSSQSDMAEYTL
jgi:hypothetical protein